MINVCQVCKIEFESVKSAKTCSPKCRVTLQRLRVTDNPNVTLAEPVVTRAVTFKFTTKYVPTNEPQDDLTKQRSVVRESKYWYDVPLGAIPVIEKGYPKMPDFMNGREYFLWWKNEFKVNDDGDPIIFNPGKKYDRLEYVQAGEQSRRWGV